MIDYLPMLLPSALGLAAIYLLLPRANRYPPAYGAVLGCLALIAAGWLLIRSDWPVVETVLFCIFAGLAIVFAALMIAQRNPVHAALSFAMVVLSTCGLFLLQAAPFLMAATTIIYAGAIVVVFLFVIMLAQQAGQASADLRSREPFLSCVAGFVLLASLLYLLHRSYNEPNGTVFDTYAESAERACKVSTVKDWQEILGDNDAFFVRFRQVADALGQQYKPDATRRALGDAIQNAEVTWSAIRPSNDGQPREDAPDLVQQFKKEMAEVCRLSASVRQRQGSLFPAQQLPLSEFSGTPPNVPFEFTGSKPKERLPAANVAGLGKALFTDYLLAVELAGTLLLVAMIGAIAIAGRRPEGLR